MKYILFFICFCASLQAQRRLVNASVNQGVDNDTLVVDNGSKDSIKIYKPTIEDYKYQTQFSEVKRFDTTFTAQKSYEYTQYNNRDNFGKVQFANIGSGFQSLVYQYRIEANLTLLPERKSHFILGIDDVKYYDVKTPTTSFVYHTAMKNGAALQSTYTQNLGKNFNFAVEYMGLRSQGFYQNSLATNNSVVFSGKFNSEDGKYVAFAHYIHQNVNNEENGGIQDLSLFTGDDSRFKNRENLEVNLSDSDSRFSYRRYYFSHSFRPFTSEKFPFKIRHTIFHQGNKYYFNLASSDVDYFNNALVDRSLRSKKYSNNLSNAMSVLFDNEKFKLDVGVRHQSLSFGVENGVENAEMKEQRFGTLGNLKIVLWEKLDLKSYLEYSTGSRFGNYLVSQNQVEFEPIKDYFVNAHLNFQSAAPSFNYLMNLSPISNFNYTFSDFKNETVFNIGGVMGTKWLSAKLFADYFRIDNYTYFTSEGQSRQSDTSLNISQIGGEATFNYGVFYLNTKLLFQSNLTNRDLLPMPQFIGRANFYWQTKAFKNAAEIMTGIKANYFTKFSSREFSPVLNEFVLPSAKGYAIGGKPYFDVYFNMKVKTMQFYIEGQNITELFMKNEVYTAPYYPIYDFRLNLGIVWNLFH